MFQKDKLAELLEEPVALRAPLKEEPNFGSVEHLIGWLETKPPHQIYSYMSLDNCLLAQYAKAHLPAQRGYATWYSIALEYFEGSEVEIVTRRPNTFGAALKRARKSIQPPFHERILAALSRALSFQAERSEGGSHD